jgi:hypothetical protein
MKRTVFTTIEIDPGRIHIAMFEGHGVDEKAIRKELTLGEMADLSVKLSKALWARIKTDEELMAELDSLAKDIISGARVP